jgi:hypothetical protein
MLSFTFLFHIHNRVKNISKHAIFNVHDIKVMSKKISTLIRKLPENTSLYLIMGQIKTIKLLFTGLKTNHNSTPRRTILNLMIVAVQHPFKIWQQRSQFYSFCTCDPLARTTDYNKKKIFYHYLLTWRPCYFSYSMDMLVLRACSNQKPFHT